MIIYKYFSSFNHRHITTVYNWYHKKSKQNKLHLSSSYLNLIIMLKLISHKFQFIGLFAQKSTSLRHSDGRRCVIVRSVQRVKGWIHFQQTSLLLLSFSPPKKGLRQNLRSSISRPSGPIPPGAPTASRPSASPRSPWYTERSRPSSFVLCSRL